MSIIDKTKFDFSVAATSSEAAGQTAVVRNETSTTVLHVALKSPEAWIDVYPAEFALAPRSAQTVAIRLAPENSRDALVPASVKLFGQFLHVNANETGHVPPDVSIDLKIVPPAANCPICGTLLPEQARECKRCGERIRLCPVCAAPNTWVARTCRLNGSHVIRTEVDWLTSPGGDSVHGAPATIKLGPQLARKWSLPTFAPTRAADIYEWSAPLAAFGMLFASAIDTVGNRSFVQAFEMATGAALWDLELPDPKGVYPDRGSMALSTDGILYVATLGGHVTAIDAVRGTLKWSEKFAGTVYGGAVIPTSSNGKSGELLLVPIGDSLTIINRLNGKEIRRHELGARLDTAPCASNVAAYVADEDGIVIALDLGDGRELWRATLDGAFDAAPILRDGVLYAATMSGTVYALDASTGAERWQSRATVKPVAVSPALSADGLLYVAADDGSLHIIAADTGNLVRSRKLSNAPLRNSPVTGGGTVFLGADDGNIYSVDADYGVHLAYETSAGSRIAGAGLAMYGNLIAFSSTNGVLYVLEAKS